MKNIVSKITGFRNSCMTLLSQYHEYRTQPSMYLMHEKERLQK